MRRLALLAALALAPAGAASAQATPPAELVASFRTLCEATGGQGGEALAAADKAGWSSLPEGLLGGFAGQFQNAAGRLRSSGSGIQFLLTGEQTRQIAGRSLKMRACALGASTPDPAQAEALLQAAAGVPRDPTLSQAPRVGWAYAEDAGGHRPMSLSDRSGVEDALAAGKLRLLIKQTAPASIGPGGLTLVIYAVPVPAGG